MSGGYRPPTVPARLIGGIMIVAVLGCGPAGLAATKAVLDSGHTAVIISNNSLPSQQYGCQYLHAPIPGYEDVPSVRVSYSLRGTPEQYRGKVYGYRWRGKVSPEDFVGEHMAWDIRETYTMLWNDIVATGAAEFITAKVADGYIPFQEAWDFVISTVPARALCSRPSHKFDSHTIWANGSMSAGIAKENYIICDGTPAREWYRLSNVFGFVTTEWTLPPGPYHRAVPVVKPLVTDCDCHPEVFRVGRYGSWEKARLVHEVYPAVTEALNAETIQKMSDSAYDRWRNARR